jgi:Tfp pilus assembly protein PilE
MQHHHNQRGFGIVEVVVLIVLLAIIGLLGWRVLAAQGAEHKSDQQQTKASAKHSKKASEQNKSKTKSPALAPKPTQRQRPSGTATSVRLYDSTNGSATTLGLVLPPGWKKLDNYGNLTRTIGGINYRISFQATASDYLPGYIPGARLLQQVRTAHGTAAYVIRGAYYVGLSKCLVDHGVGCSFTRGGKYVFVLMHTYRQGHTDVGSLDFSRSSTTTAIHDFERIAKSLDI